MKQITTETLLARLRDGEELLLRDRLLLTIKLSLPAILAQISSVIMQYIDASMVGQLGATDSASIGLVSTSTWLFGGLCISATAGFTVLVAQEIGAKNERSARDILKQAIVLCLGFSFVLVAIGVAIAAPLPRWLGGSAEICTNASVYFLVVILSLPIRQINSLAGGMLQCSGNMRTPSTLNITMCALDVVFNELLIFPSRSVTVAGATFTMPGAGLGVMGAALGTALADGIVALLMLWILLFRTPLLQLRSEEPIVFRATQIAKAVKIAVPVAAEQIIRCGAMIGTTLIVSPLGTVSIAANSFAITAESICYMPGFGIATAATTLVGQSIGAARHKLARSLAWLTTVLGMLVMALTGLLMYVFAPQMIGMLTPEPAIRQLGIVVLRIEAFCEPLYGASIVAAGALRGAGDTMMSTCLNFASLWLIRLPLAIFLAPKIGLRGVWIAMCVELCVRGLLFILRLKSNGWIKGYTIKSK